MMLESAGSRAIVIAEDNESAVAYLHRKRVVFPSGDQVMYGLTIGAWISRSRG
jgi:hypothetical protein